MRTATTSSGVLTSAPDDFFRQIDWSKDDDWAYLKVGQSEWRTATLPSEAGERQLAREYALCVSEASRLAQSDEFYSVRRIGRFVRIRRLARGPVRKLSDWHQLSDGDCMLVHPEPTDEDLQRADSRIWYLAQQGARGYHAILDGAGALWICRGRSNNLTQD